MLDKITKLLRLAHSPHIAEAKLAFEKAKELAARENIDLWQWARTLDIKWPTFATTEPGQRKRRGRPPKYAQPINKPKPVKIPKYRTVDKLRDIIFGSAKPLTLAAILEQLNDDRYRLQGSSLVNYLNNINYFKISNGSHTFYWHRDKFEKWMGSTL